MKAMTMDIQKSGFGRVTEIAMKMYRDAVPKARSNVSRRAAALLRGKAEPPKLEPPRVNDVESIKNPLKTGVAFTHPHSEMDGVDHINIDSRAKTELGRWLTHMQEAHFKHTRFGPFSSMEGFWAFARNGCTGDQYRRYRGMTAVRASRKIETRKLANFYEIMLEANYAKIDQHPAFKKALIESTLPFEHYYIHGPKGAKAGSPGILIKPAMDDMMVTMMTQLREMFRNGEVPAEPDYSDLFLINQERSAG